MQFLPVKKNVYWRRSFSLRSVNTIGFGREKSIHEKVATSSPKFEPPKKSNFQNSVPSAAFLNINEGEKSEGNNS